MNNLIDSKFIYSLFSAKTLYDGKWITGSLYLNNEIPVIILPIMKDDEDSANTMPEFHLIQPDTLCRHCNRYDMDGLGLFENDIVLIASKKQKEICEIVFDDKYGIFILKTTILEKNIALSIIKNEYLLKLGNKFDNIKLLEK